MRREKEENGIKFKFFSDSLRLCVSAFKQLMKNESLFQKNLELWARQDPKSAFMLPYYDPADVEHVKTKKGEPNLRCKIDGQWVDLHDSKGALDEANAWFKQLDLHKVTVIYVYGVGLGYALKPALDWLKKKADRRIVFLEDNMSVIYRFLETTQATDVLKHPKVQLFYFKSLTENDPLFELLYWNFSLTRMRISALNSYATSKKETFEAFNQKMTYDFAVKNALVDEYLRFGGAFFVNFYQNMLSLPGSYLGNNTFGSFKKVPAIICGAGPSLGKQMDQLEKVLDKALVFAGGSALNALNAHGLQPHLGAGIDPNPAQFDRLSKNQAYEVPFYYRNRMYHDAFKMISGPRLYVTGCGGYDVSDFFEKKLNIEHEFLDEGHNVINFCLQIANQLGCDPIIFVGLDLAFTGMKSYAPGIEEDATFDPAAYGEVDEFDEKPILRKDIYGKPLYTLWKWVAEADWISTFAKENSQVTIINATEGGLGFKDVPNRTFKEVCEDYLHRPYPIRDRLHSEIQNSALPQVTMRKMVAMMDELKESLKRCVGHFDVLIDEIDRSDSSKYSQSGRAALCETELAEEPAFLYILDIFNEVKVRLYSRHLHELKSLSESKKIAQKKKFNKERFQFLRECAKVNIGLIDMALERREKSKRSKKQVQKHKTIEKLASVVISDLKIPEKGFEGQSVGKNHIVTMLREYGQPPVEVRLEQRGELDGECKLYYPDGTLKARMYYEKGVLHGPSSFYSPKGHLLAQSVFVRGKQEGVSLWYYPSGALYARHNYHKGILHGLQEYFHEDGKVKTSLQYDHGKFLTQCR